MKLAVPDKHAAKLARMYGQAQLELVQRINAALSRGAQGTAGWYAQQLFEVQELLRATDEKAHIIALEGISQSYISGALIAERVLHVGGGFTGVHETAVNVLAQNLTQPLSEATQMVGRNVEDVFRRAALEDVTQGIIQASTRKEVSAALKNNLVRQGVTAFVDKRGRRWSLQSYTEMVARTTTREAVSHGTANRMLENGHDLATISHHVHDPDICSDFDGKTFSLTGETEGYELLTQYPPFHPRCVHVLTPSARTFFAFARAVEADAQTAKPRTVVTA